LLFNIANMDPKTNGFDYSEPGIGRFTLLNFVHTFVGILLIIFNEKKIWTKLLNNVNNRLMNNNAVRNNNSNVIFSFLLYFINFD
jgi:hypothetical protein